LRSLARSKLPRNIARSLTRRVMPSPGICPEHSNTKPRFNICATQSKLSLAARYARNLYECALSANNADSTL